MEFFDDPQEEKLRNAQDHMRIWAWSQKERGRTGVSPLFHLMMSVRNTKECLKRAEEKIVDRNKSNDMRRDLVLGKTISITRQEKLMIAQKVDKIMNDPELWRGHYRDKEVLAMFYLDKTANLRGCNESVKALSNSLRVPRWKVKNMIRTSLMYFSTLYGEIL